MKKADKKKQDDRLLRTLMTMYDKALLVPFNSSPQEAVLSILLKGIDEASKK